jgi:hypothetical protein
MENLIGPLVVPFLLTILLFLFTRRINVIALGGGLLLTLAVVGCSFEMFKDQQTTDKEFLNGHITQIASEHVSCDHCAMWVRDCDSKGQNCTSRCAYYEHPYDVTYYATTDFVKFYQSEGTIVYGAGYPPNDSPPAAWSALRIGQPVTRLHNYTNWVRGNGDSIFFPKSALTDPLQTAGLIPPRPTDLYNGVDNAPKFLYTSDITPTDASLVKVKDHTYTSQVYDAAIWNLNADIGNSKQADINILPTTYADLEYANAVRAGWHGGSKNNVDIFMGVNPAGDIQWVSVKYGLPGTNQAEANLRSGDNELLAIRLRDRILDEGKNLSKSDKIMSIIREEVTNLFDRKPNKDYIYLSGSIHLDEWQIVLMYVVSIIFSVGTLVVAEASRSD